MELEVKTKLGTLRASADGDVNYPGIMIYLVRDDGMRILYAWVEVDETEAEPVLKVHAFNSYDDEPEFDLDQTADDINNYGEETE